MKQLKNILIGILITGLVTINSIASNNNPIIVTGNAIRVEHYSLYEDSFDYDTLSCFKMAYYKNSKLELIYGDSELGTNSGVVCKFKENEYSVKIKDEILILDSVSRSVYHIGEKTYEVLLLNVNSKTDEHLNLTYFILKDYGIVISKSHLWNNHIRYLPNDLNKSLEINMLCDLILTRMEFEDYHKGKSNY